jgi:hypothetical protein
MVAYNSHCLYNVQVVKFLDAFLGLSPRTYDDEDSRLLPTVAEEGHQLTYRVLKVYLRLIGPDDGSTVVARSPTSERAYAKLLWQKRVIDLPKVILFFMTAHLQITFSSPVSL